MVTLDVISLEAGQVANAYVLDDAGMILDRVRIARLQNGFLVLGSLGAGDLLNRWFEQWRQLGWSDLAVFITDMSAYWSALSVAGPRAGEVFAKLREGEGAPEAMTCLEAEIAGLTCRIVNASSLDAPDIEIHVPASAAAILWTRLMAAGPNAEIVPVGLDARNMAEIEAGGMPLHTVYGCRWSAIDFEPVNALEAKQEDFIGKRMALKTAGNGSARPQRVLLEPDNEDLIIPEGAVLVSDATGRKTVRPVGYVIAGGIGPKTGRAFALGFLEQGRESAGKSIGIFIDGKTHSTRVAMVTPIPEETTPESAEEVLEDA